MSQPAAAQSLDRALVSSGWTANAAPINLDQLLTLQSHAKRFDVNRSLHEINFYGGMRTRDGVAADLTLGTVAFGLSVAYPVWRSRRLWTMNEEIAAQKRAQLQFLHTDGQLCDNDYQVAIHQLDGDLAKEETRFWSRTSSQLITALATFSTLFVARRHFGRLTNYVVASMAVPYTVSLLAPYVAQRLVGGQSVADDLKTAFYFSSLGFGGVVQTYLWQGAAQSGLQALRRSGAQTLSYFGRDLTQKQLLQELTFSRTANRLMLLFGLAKSALLMRDALHSSSHEGGDGQPTWQTSLFMGGAATLASYVAACGPIAVAKLSTSLYSRSLPAVCSLGHLSKVVLHGGARFGAMFAAQPFLLLFDALGERLKSRLASAVVRSPLGRLGRVVSGLASLCGVGARLSSVLNFSVLRKGVIGRILQMPVRFDRPFVPVFKHGSVQCVSLHSVQRVPFYAVSLASHALQIGTNFAVDYALTSSLQKKS